MERLKIWSSLLYQRIIEYERVVEAILFLLALAGFGLSKLGKRSLAVKLLSQVHRSTRSERIRGWVEQYILANRSTLYALQTSAAEKSIGKLSGNRLLVLKAPASGGEKGVLFVMFTEVIRQLATDMDLPRLMRDYTLVFEPSWSGYCLPEFLQFTQFAEEIFVLAAEESDLAFLRRLRSNLVPIPMGPGDWVDPRLALPYLANPKEFDIVMNAHWAAWKRHYVLFHMLARAKQKYKVALIGVKWNGKTSEDIKKLARFYGVLDQISIYERVPYEKVMDVTARSKVSILLSLKEGGNRAIPESIFCNVPVVVLSNNIGGVKKNVVPQTGVRTDEGHLEMAIAEMLHSSLRPRAWAVENISCFKSSEKLNALLRDHALKRGEPWTQDLAGRSCSPESRYISNLDGERLRPWNQHLTNYLLENP